MGVLTNLEPKEVFEFFEEICAIPHGSRDTKRISDYLVAFAKERSLEHYQDELNNVVIIKEATKGYEKSEPIILQGHMDMVCEKTPESTIDFTKDGLTLAIDGDWLHAVGTTLGGDDGIAVAMALAALDSDTLEHPRLEAVFTVDEELGMEGAEGLDVSMLNGEKFLNMDSEEEGIFTVSCAGGVTADSFVPVKREQAEGRMLHITIGGLQGGHSGAEIDKERGSANVLIGRALYYIDKVADVRLVSCAGGSKDNAITKMADAEILVSEADVENVKEAVAELDHELKHEYVISDTGVYAKCEDMGHTTGNALDIESSERAISFMMCAPHGILNMSVDIKGLVETSLNLGVLKLTESELRATFAIRSAVQSRQDYLADKVVALTESLGGTVQFSGAYPGWEYRQDSPFRDTCVAVFKKLYGKEPDIEAIHAGLECGLFSGKMNGKIDAVSIGPDMTGVHTSDERLSIPSVKRTWEFVCEVLKKSK